MVIIGKKFGRLANRLWLFANFVALARRYRVTVANPAFAEYAAWFSATEHDLWCRYPVSCGAAAELPGEVPGWRRELLYQSVYRASRGLVACRLKHRPWRIIREKEAEFADLAGDAWRRQLAQGTTTIVHGWNYRDDAGVLEHATAIRAFLTPLPVLALTAERVAEQARGDCDVLIGVHLRQGDYATFSGGAYYFPAATYAAAMHQWAQLFAPRRCAFLVCSDARQAADAFTGLHVTRGSGHVIEDLYALAACDYLMGPPSTFSAWASYYGQVPLWMLQNAEMPRSLDQFSSRYYAPDAVLRKSA